MNVSSARTSSHHAPAPLEWLIVGGGVHGTHLAHVLVNALGVVRDRLRVWTRMLSRWPSGTA